MAFCAHWHFSLIFLLIFRTLIPMQDSHPSPKMHTTDLTLSAPLPKCSFKDPESHEVQFRMESITTKKWDR